MGVKVVRKIRIVILLATIISSFIILSGNAFAEVTAIPTCQLCTEYPCTSYCATPPCIACEGEEGDSFIFFGGNSVGPAGMDYNWDFYGNGSFDITAKTAVNPYYSPHNPAVHPDGWPASLNVYKDGESDTSAPLYVKVNNVAPTPIMFVYDIADNQQYEEAYVKIDTTILFHAELSHDKASSSMVCTEGETYCGIENPEVDFSYDGITFITEYTGKVIQHSWSTPGDYLVRLKITDKDTPPMVSYTNILIHAIPEGPYVFITGPTESFTEGQQVGFTANKLQNLLHDIVSYEWDFDYDPANGFNSMGTGEAIYHRFPTARPMPEAEPYEPYFKVACKTTDSNGGTFIATEKYYPTNIDPVAVLEVKNMDNEVQLPVEYITINPDTPEAEGIPVYEFNEGQIMKFDSMKSYAGCLPSPETCVEDGGRYAPDEDPPVVTNAPGSIVSVQWDWNYSNLFIPSTEDLNRIETHAYSEDTDHNVTPGTPIAIMLRVIDDDTNIRFTSEDYTQIFVRVLDVEPIAEIRECDSNGLNCVAPSSTPEYQESVSVFLRAADISNNTDTVTSVEWDFNYSGVEEEFTTEQTTNTITEVIEHKWLEVGTYTIGVRITDDDTKESYATQLITITDMPPTAIITPNNGTVIEVNEGDTIRFSAETSLVSSGDGFTRFRWDYDYNQSTFTPRAELDYEPNCDTETNTCKKFDDFTCESNDNCPWGKGYLERTVYDGPATQYIAVCVEDADTWVRGDNPNTGLCVSGADPTDSTISPRIATLEIQIKNVAPVFTNEPALTIYEGQSFKWQPTISDPAGSNDSYYYVCDFDKLPPRAECDPVQGLIIWEPQASEVSCPPNVVKEHHFEHTVCDNDGDCSTYKGDITVLNQNDPPTITGYNGNTVVPIGDEAIITLNVSDPDTFCGNESFNYYICKTGYYTTDMSFPGGLNTFYWSPGENDLGQKTVKLCARDDECTDTADKCNDCGEGSSCIEILFNIADSNNLPVVDLEDDFRTPAGQVCIEGTHGGQSTETWDYIWRQISVASNVCLQNMNTYPDDPKGCFATSVHGDYEIGLHAYNGSNDGQEKSIIVTVENTKPGAVLQGDRNYDLGTIVTLNGSLSGDYNENDSVTYAWTDDPSILVEADKSNVSPNFQTNTEKPSLYNFSLSLKDSVDATTPENYATVTIESMDVDDSGKVVSALPFAFFESKICDNNDNCESTDTTQPAVGEKFILDASKSASRSATSKVSLDYHWSCVESPADPTYTYPDDYTATISTFKAGKYVFKLEVTEGELRSKPAYKTVFVAEENNYAPIADAGNDITDKQIKTTCTAPITKYATITLDGSASRDPESKPLTYNWKQIKGIIVPLHNADTATPSFLAFKPGLYSFELTVNDGTLDSEPDVVHVSVISENGSLINTALSYNGASNGNLYYANPGDTITLDASNSGSLTGSEFYFDWSQTSGPSIVLSDWEDDVITFTPDITGVIYSFSLLVSDNLGNVSLPMDINVSVLSQANTTPVCSVSEKIINAQAGSTVELDGSSTYDQENDTLTYLWEQVVDSSTQEVTINNANQAKASFTPTVSGMYTFKFSAFDGIVSCTPIEVTVNVSGNSKPSADAGDDQTVCLGEEVQLDGSGSFDPDNNELEYEWKVEDDGDIGLTADDLKPDKTDAKPTFEPINPGTVILSLVVDDGLDNGTSEKDEVTINIKICDGDIDGDLDDDTNDNPDPTDGDTTENGGGGGGCTSISSSYASMMIFLFASLIILGLIRRRRID